MIRVSSVSYLNSIPFVYGIKNSGLLPDVELSLDVPSECARKLLNNQVDIGLVPAVLLHDLPNAKIISGYCIGAEGKVLTVSLLSDVPLSHIQKIYLDYQSRTSVELLKILVRDYWGIQPEFCNSYPGYEIEIGGTTAGLVIGDRVFGLTHKFKYNYDLSEEWYKMTGMPFVFACWVSVNPLSEEFLSRFEKALSFGLLNIPEAIASFAGNRFSAEPLAYLEKFIRFELDPDKKKALSHFLSLSEKANIRSGAIIT